MTDTLTLAAAFPGLADTDELRAEAKAPLRDLRAGERWGAIVAAMVESALRRRAVPILELCPGLGLCAADLAVEGALSALGAEPLATRSRNISVEHDLTRCGELGETRPGDLLKLPHSGVKTVRDLLRAAVEIAAHAYAIAPPDLLTPAAVFTQETPRPAAYPELMRFMEKLQLLAQWAIAENVGESLADLAEVLLARRPLPPDLAEAAEVVLATPLAGLLQNRTEDYEKADLRALHQQLLAELSELHQRILRERVLPFRPPTLDELGTQLGVTRERVRQIQLAVEARLEELISRPRFAPLRWRAHTLARHLGACVPARGEAAEGIIELYLMDTTALDGGSAADDAELRALLLHLGGPYREAEGLLVRGDVPPFREGLGALADENGLIPYAQAAAWLADRGILPGFHDLVLERAGGFRREGDWLLVWRHPIASKAVALLALRGEPADAQTLADQIGEGGTALGLRARLFPDERLMRVNRTEWALRSWGLEEYSGIAEEIVERIQARGGRVGAADIVAELVSTFGVKEVSVSTYLAAPLFVVEDGWVRLRRDDELPPPPTDLRQARGVFRLAPGQFAWLMPVTRDVLRGSGQVVPRPLAGVLGVGPGQRRRFDSSPASLVIGWSISSALGPTIGSTRAAALALGAAEGDLLRFTFDAEAGTASAAHLRPADLAARDPLAAAAELVGVPASSPDELGEALAAAVEAPRPALRRALEARGDDLLLSLLPD